MRLQKIYSQGIVKNQQLYEYLQKQDGYVFPNCDNEFKSNRDWWVTLDNGFIVAYCGCLYSQGICIFVRAWVHKRYRGKGLQRKMIKARLKAAKTQCKTAITYTMPNNIHSINNLFKSGFTVYNPEYAYAGREMLYFKRKV